ncbi:MAG: dihydroorotase [Bacteroidales bacterium]|nr:dihydroorotase [Bacteroidales bacterium]MCM1147964.1 dihydroorotase [Bacteroidales bacterium]MCM1206888.1 dihydroorotase [Bacillota bacterium]MCM1509521.1 dihydroorotase [Clostridium sp.]
MRILIKNGTIVNEGKSFVGSIIIEDDRINTVLPSGKAPRGVYDKEIDATGCLVLPGIIDSHVHFREPGLVHKADIESESRAAAYGGVTTYFDMPNTKPQTTSAEALEEKFRIASRKSHVNHSFFFGSANDNIDTIANIDRHRIPGIKLFMGSSTGNMLVDSGDSLERIFKVAHELDMPLMAHCEDTDIINANMAKAKALYGDDPDVAYHPLIRSSEACIASAKKGLELAEKYGTRFHLAHVSTKEELALVADYNIVRDGEAHFSADSLPRITCEATVSHLLFHDKDYGTLGTRIKCNPAIKGLSDRNALRQGLSDGRIFTVGTDHAPHTLDEKAGGAAQAVSGMPMLQFSLITMLSLVDEGILSVERLVELMCHNPARIFSVSERGFLRENYKADIAIVSKNIPEWTLTADDIQSKCRWSPLEGQAFRWRVLHTLCNGKHILDDGIFDEKSLGEEVRFR